MPRTTVNVSCEHNPSHGSIYSIDEVVVVHNTTHNLYAYAYTCNICRCRSVLPLKPLQVQMLLESGCQVVTWTDPVIETITSPPISEAEVIEFISALHTSRSDLSNQGN
jgi:hypothetical protein